MESKYYKRKKEDEFKLIQDNLNEEILKFSKFYLKNQILFNKELSDVYKGAVEMLERYREVMNHARECYVRYKEVGIFNKEGRMLDAYKTHCLDNYEIMDKIHDEVNAGEKFGYYHLVDISREYLNRLDIIK